jgi:phenylacetate-CoA ligase
MHNPAVETLPFEAQAAADDPAYRAQIERLFERSPFYRRKLTEAGFTDATGVGGLADIGRLPFTEKDELRASRTPDNPIGAHLAADQGDIVRIYSTSGTTGTPSYIPVTSTDLADWIEISCRSYSASGLRSGERIITTYNAGPFVAGATLDAFAALGLCHIPIGSGNTERLMMAVQLLKPDVIALTPSYALHLAEWAQARSIDLRASSVRRLLVAGEPGGGEPDLRARLEEAWGARVTEAMGIGDISISLWGECEQQAGMHFSGRGYVHVELVDPVTGDPIVMEDGAEGELVYTHLRQRAAPLLRFRSRDHVRISATPCRCGRTAPRVRCIGRTDDMLIVRGVNVFPTAVREVVAGFAPAVSGLIAIRPPTRGVKQSPPLPIVVELAEGVTASEDLAGRIGHRLREVLLVATRIEFVAWGTLPRSDYKSKLVDWSAAEAGLG